MDKKRNRDFKTGAFQVVRKATMDKTIRNVGSESIADKIVGKNPNAVALGRLGGLKGGKARAESLTPEQRRKIAERAAKFRWMSLYDEVKATQVASMLLELNGGKMDYAKCIKLLYNIEREALNRWMRPVIYDDLFSLPHGQVVSKTLDKAKVENQDVDSFWQKHIRTLDGNNIKLINECGKGKLSKAEINLINEYFKKYQHQTAGQMMDEHHDPGLFPEWKNPNGSSSKTSYQDLLCSLGKTDEQIREFEEDLVELKRLKHITK